MKAVMWSKIKREGEIKRERDTHTQTMEVNRLIR